MTTTADGPARILRAVPTGPLDLPGFSGGGVIAASRPDLPGHHALHGDLPDLSRQQLLTSIERSGLTGRGGAGFPTSRKLAAVARAAERSGRAAVVVANGAEGEPASAKDRTLMTHGPHLVLDGLQVAAYAVGAGRAVAYVPAGRAGEGIVRAVGERRDAGRDGLPVELVEAPDTFVAGQATAVAARVEGRPAIPMTLPARLAESGIDRRPTLVQNVETLAHLALVARYGPDWFRGSGTAEEPGTFLATVSGAVGAPGVYEFGYGEPLGAVLADAGGATAPLQAVLVGGYHGAWVPMPAGAELPMSLAGLAPLGAAPGAGVVVALPVTACGVVESARIAAYLAGQSAGQCGPCRNGLPAMADALGRLAAGERDPRLVGWVQQLTGLVEDRGACKHPDGTARMVRSALRIFDPEVQLHLRGGCSARGQR